MMASLSIFGLEEGYAAVMLASLVLGGVSGFVMHRADFCMVAAFRDFFLFRNTRLLKGLLVLVMVSALLFEGVHLAGWLPRYPFPLLAPPSLAGAIGGMFFGLGMVLAGGCVVGILYRVGAGHFFHAVTLIGLLFGSLIYAEFHPLWAKFFAHLRLSQEVTLPLISATPSWLWLLTLIILFFLLLRRQLFFPQGGGGVDGYLSPQRAGIVLAFVGVVSALLLGMPLGVTTTYAKVAGMIETFIFPDHVVSLAYFKLSPLNLKIPLATQPLQGGTAPLFDGVMAVQAPLILGVILGGGVSAWRLREFHPVWLLPRRQWASLLVGGILMGMGARMAAGCNIWHLWGGIPLFAGASLLFVLGLLPGAWLGGVVLTRVVLPNSTR